LPTIGSWDTASTLRDSCRSSSATQFFPFTASQIFSPALNPDRSPLHQSRSLKMHTPLPHDPLLICPPIPNHRTPPTPPSSNLIFFGQKNSKKSPQNAPTGSTTGPWTVPFCGRFLACPGPPKPYCAQRWDTRNCEGAPNPLPCPYCVPRWPCSKLTKCGLGSHCNAGLLYIRVLRNLKARPHWMTCSRGL
jgi:hypothetical protein